MTDKTSLARVSVIIAAFNAEHTIKRTLHSVLSQTIAPFEIIVVDDGSTDGTVEAVRSISHDSLRLVCQGAAGQSAALNAGARLSRGDFIKFVDADDLLNSTHISAQLEVLQGAENCVASCMWGYFVGSSGVPTIRDEHTQRDYSDPLEWIIDSLHKDEGMMGGWMWLIPRHVWEKSGGWNESLTLNNDFDFSIRLLLASSGVRFAPSAVYCYRKGISNALSAERNTSAMRSAFATTKFGCDALLNRENSGRVRRICADRWQWWLYHFYPEHADLATQAEQIISELGGSSVELKGGTLMSLFLPLFGWKRVRRIQSVLHKTRWKRFMMWKQARLLRQMTIL